MYGSLGIQNNKLKRATEILDRIETRLNKGWLETTNEMTKQNEDAFERDRQMKRESDSA